MSTFAGKLLRIDLSTQKGTEEPIPEKFLREYISARGLAAKYLYDELTPGINPLSSQNKLIFSAGVLAGTGIQGFSRWAVSAKSPLTGTIFRSVSGGNFGVWMKYAGYDLIILEGKSANLSTIHINSQGVCFGDASEFSGLDYRSVQQKLRQIHGPKTESACIGLAGEKLVKYAVISDRERTAARGGMGTVMGSKNLKAISINVSVRRPEPADWSTLKTLVSEQRAILKSHPRREKMNTVGTTYVTTVVNGLGILPTKNFQEGSIANVEAISAERFHEEKLATAGCFSCTTRCGGLRKVANGPLAGTNIDGPEYETIFAFGSLLNVTDRQFIVDANGLCDFYGMDTMSTGVSVAFAIELFERGIIDRKETEGLNVCWGDKKDLFILIEQIGQRKGFGKLLGEGVRKAAEAIGGESSKYAMHSKGLELPGYEARAVKGYALSYASSNLGANHMYGRPRKELSGEVNPFTEKNKGDSIAQVQKEQALEDSLIACTFGNSGLSLKMYGRFLAAATGISEFLDQDNLLKIGERVVCLERCFNLREGFTRKDDTLPDRILSEPLQNAGPATGQVVENLDGLLDELYYAFGYTKDGIPTAEKLKELGLETIKQFGGLGN